MKLNQCYIMVIGGGGGGGAIGGHVGGSIYWYMHRHKIALSFEFYTMSVYRFCYMLIKLHNLRDGVQSFPICVFTCLPVAFIT